MEVALSFTAPYTKYKFITQLIIAVDKCSMYAYILLE